MQFSQFTQQMIEDPERYPQDIKGYKFQKVIGSGTYGVVAIFQKEQEKVAVKFETTTNNLNQLLTQESRILKDLSLKGMKAAPKYIDHGTKQVIGKELCYNFLMMEYIEQSVYDYIEQNGKDHQKIGQISIKFLEALQELHELGYIHKDIKPDNFRFKGDQVYLIDFGLSKEWRDLKFGKQKVMKGTPLFYSLSTHLNYEMGRLDDIISLLYSILFISRGQELPLYNPNLTTEFQFQTQTMNTIRDLKQQIAECDFTVQRDRKLARIIKEIDEMLGQEEYFEKDPDYERIKTQLEGIDEEEISGIDYLELTNAFDMEIQNVHCNKEWNNLTRTLINIDDNPKFENPKKVPNNLEFQSLESFQIINPIVGNQEMQQQDQNILNQYPQDNVSDLSTQLKESEEQEEEEVKTNSSLKIEQNNVSKEINLYTDKDLTNCINEQYIAHKKFQQDFKVKIKLSVNNIKYDYEKIIGPQVELFQLVENVNKLKIQHLLSEIEKVNLQIQEIDSQFTKYGVEFQKFTQDQFHKDFVYFMFNMLRPRNQILVNVEKKFVQFTQFKEEMNNQYQTLLTFEEDCKKYPTTQLTDILTRYQAVDLFQESLNHIFYTLQTYSNPDFIRQFYLYQIQDPPTKNSTQEGRNVSISFFKEITKSISTPKDWIRMFKKKEVVHEIDRIQLIGSDDSSCTIKAELSLRHSLSFYQHFVKIIDTQLLLQFVSKRNSSNTYIKKIKLTKKTVLSNEIEFQFNLLINDFDNFHIYYCYLISIDGKPNDFYYTGRKVYEYLPMHRKLLKLESLISD